MIMLNKRELKDKIYACWLGKNIGGTLGGPYEWSKTINNCTGFTSKPGSPLPNDDLDLQLVWLKAMEELGPHGVNSNSLGEYWLEYITPFWNEYGISKANMKMGLVPPLSGQYENYWNNSNGAWIRSEIWACLFPGCVEQAVRYAVEDASVDHGNGEGTFSAIFTAAVESAAFVIKDLRLLIEIGLSKIPASSLTHKYITVALDCFDRGKTWQEARNILTDMSLSDKNLGWFQAPANVGYAIIGLLYGKGDFKQTLLIACNCGDDTDCSCATAGAILGIANGTSIIPDDWKTYIGDDIITNSVNVGATPVPKTCSELTDRIIALHPVTLYKGSTIITDGKTDTPESDMSSFMGCKFAESIAALSNYRAVFKSVLVSALVEYDRAPQIEPNGTIGIKISLRSDFPSQKIFTVKWYTPLGFSVTGKKSFPVMREREAASADYIITAPSETDSKNCLFAVISCEGHFDTLTVPIVLLG